MHSRSGRQSKRSWRGTAMDGSQRLVRDWQRRHRRALRAPRRERASLINDWYSLLHHYHYHRQTLFLAVVVVVCLMCFIFLVYSAFSRFLKTKTKNKMVTSLICMYNACRTTFYSIHSHTHIYIYLYKYIFERNISIHSSEVQGSTRSVLDCSAFHGG